MVKKRTKKILLFSSISLITIGALATAIPFIIKNKNNNINNFKNRDSKLENYKYLFNNRYYDSIDDISSELLSNYNLVSNSLYYGDINEAIFDQEFKRLDINRLRKYDPKKISSAYITSTGNYESDFQKAKKSFINQGLVRYFYLDNQGKLHYNFESAKQSNINNIKIDEIFYYKVKDKYLNGKDIEINPLNEKDINKFKEIAINRLKDGEEQNDGFKLKIFSKDKNNRTNENKYTFDKVLTKFISNNDNFDNLFEDIENIINSTIQKSKELRYDFKMTLNHNQKNNYQFVWWKNSKGEKYETWNARNKKGQNDPQIEIDQKNNKILYFKNFSIIEIEGLLNRFSERSEFENNDKGFLKNKIETQKWAANDVADECYWDIDLDNSNNSKNHYSIHFDYCGNDKGGSWGTDISILKDGSGDGGVGFTIELIDRKINNKTINYEDMIFNEIEKSVELWLENEFKNNKNEVSKDLVDIIIKLIFETNKNIIKEEIYNKITNRNNDKNCQSYLKKRENDKNYYYDKYEITGEDENNNNKLIYGIYLKNDIKNNTIYNILSYIKSTNKKIKVVICYNDFPVFEYDPSDFINNKYSNINSNNISKLFKNNLLNINNNEFDLINNISSYKNLKINSDYNSFIENDEHIFKINKQNMFDIPEEQKHKNGKLSESNSLGKNSFNEIWYALNAYNRNLERYKKQNNNSIKDIKNKLTNNILFLRNGTGDENDGNSSQPLYYANYLGLKNDFNESISTLEKSRFAYNEFQLKQLKETSSSINPSKVIVLYNIAGDIMNPGIELDDELTINTSSDAIYDLEQNLLDNVMRTLLIKKAEDKFFYLNDDGTKTLIKNKVNQIYTLTWKGAEYYFPTFNDAKRYLNNIVELLTTKVVI